MRKSGRIYFFVGVIFMAYVSATLLLSIFLLILRRFSGKFSSQISNTGHEYQYYQKDTRLNQSFFGVASLPVEIGKDFLFFEDGDELVLISNFGEQEYECYGNCYCDEEITKRSIGYSSNVLGRGLSYLLVSISSIGAFELAREYFTNDCVKKFSETCEPDSIRSEVDLCESILNKETEDEIRDEYDDEETVYFCYGNCKSNNALKTEESLDIATNFECERLKREGDVHVYQSEVEYHKLEIQATRKLDLARRKFQKYNLVEYCRKHSVEHITYQQTANIKGNVYKNLVSRSFSMCVGENRVKGKSQIANVKCRQVDPPTEERNKEWIDRTWWNKWKVWKDIS